MTNAQFIFESLTKQDMINVVAFMEDNKTASLATAINWLYELAFINGEDCIFERERDALGAEHTRQCHIDVLAYYGHDDGYPF